jgi:hypothetical protein
LRLQLFRIVFRRGAGFEQRQAHAQGERTLEHAASMLAEVRHGSRSSPVPKFRVGPRLPHEPPTPQTCGRLPGRTFASRSTRVKWQLRMPASGSAPPPWQPRKRRLREREGICPFVDPVEKAASMPHSRSTQEDQIRHGQRRDQRRRAQGRQIEDREPAGACQLPDARPAGLAGAFKRRDGRHLHGQSTSRRPRRVRRRCAATSRLLDRHPQGS